MVQYIFVKYSSPVIVNPLCQSHQTHHLELLMPSLKRVLNISSQQGKKLKIYYFFLPLLNSSSRMWAPWLF